MKVYYYFVLLGFSAMLGGCATPQTAGEFRSSVAGSAMGHAYESFEVPRSSQAVGETLQAQAAKCIDVQVNRTVTVNPREGSGQSQSRFIYRPKVMRAGDRTEIHVQVQPRGDIKSLGREPEGGYYVLVADVNPISRSRSDVSVYYSTHRARSIAEAMKHWAAGTDMDCPDIAGTLR